MDLGRCGRRQASGPAVTRDATPSALSTTRGPGYANFTIAEPPLKLIRTEKPGHGGSYPVPHSDPEAVLEVMIAAGAKESGQSYRFSGGASST